MTDTAIEPLTWAMLCVTKGLTKGARVGRRTRVLLRGVAHTARGYLAARTGFAPGCVAGVALAMRRRARRYRKGSAAIERSIVTGHAAILWFGGPGHVL
ncbi:MAG TPA: hypothetical protein VN920_07050 [Pyrinomonadaceae bacterium]|nr:hypothetical protein [Pyrinomonadaceae bacterium]